MDQKKLDRAWRALADARRSPQTEGDLQALARMCGRTVHAGGKHPMWKSAFPRHRAFPIPCHGGNRTVSPHVRKVVIEHLEADLTAYEEILEVETRSDGNDGNGGTHGIG
jgi:hypothetical protein